jgi:hypothetical protein
MASHIGNYNPGLINQNFQQSLRSDSQAIQHAFANTGQQSQVAKTIAEPEQPGDLHHLSAAALLSLTEPGDAVKEELAQQSGLSQSNDTNESEGAQRKRGFDREQEELADKLPEGFVELAGSNGTKQRMRVEEKDTLVRLDDARANAERVLGDIPKASLSAAQAVVKSQNLKSTKPKMKSDPAVDMAASQFERSIAPLLAAPLGNREPGNDRHGLPVATLEE